MVEQRAQWKSKMGFILAASGSAIGLGNIVVFSGNAYKYGGGAFYVPYFIALFLVGIPIMILEFGLGGLTGKSFPMAMRRAGGRVGEFAGWFAILNAGFITMWYVTLLAWVVGMGVGALNEQVFLDHVTVPWVGESGIELQGPQGFFFNMISSWQPFLFVLAVWVLNVLLTSRGTKTIEAAVKVFVPLMWLAMIVLVVQGVFLLDGGFDGVKVLFTPATEALKDPKIWQGSVSQILFTLSLGFGIMTAYASYLPKKSDMTHNAVTTSLLNCGFEWLAGVAIFSILFVYTIQPTASTIAMMYFVVPWGIKALPVDHQIFGVAFFGLLLVAGLTSSISLLEALVSSILDKFRTARRKVLLIAFVVGATGSCAFALPMIINSSLSDDGTLGFTLLDIFAHWSFDTGLMLVVIVECLVIGWGMGSGKIRSYINENSRFHIGIWFDALIRFVIPGVLGFILVSNLINDYAEKGVYGSSFEANYSVPEGGFLSGLLSILPAICLAVWLIGTLGGAFLLSRGAPPPDEEAALEGGGEA
jgi:neurotransmitter:Na+ symporter, NSS family